LVSIFNIIFRPLDERNVKLIKLESGTGVVANHSEEDVSTGQQGNGSKKRESEVLNHDGVGCSTAKEGP